MCKSLGQVVVGGGDGSGGIRRDGKQAAVMAAQGARGTCQDWGQVLGTDQGAGGRSPSLAQVPAAAGEPTVALSGILGAGG